MLYVKHLCYEYFDKAALSDVSFTLKPQTITALIGPNGAGKTTLLRCLAALQSPSAGEVILDGTNVHEHPRQIHKKLGYLADDFGLYTDLTVAQCLEHAAAIQGLKGTACQEAVKQVMAKLSLDPYQDKKTSTLSRGWRQRTGIGTAIVHQPQLLLLDEPASGLDPEERQELSVLMRQLRDQGMTLIVSSHILAELESYCQNMLILREGKLVDHTVPEESQTQYKIHIILTEPMEKLESLLRQEANVHELQVQNLEATFLWGGDTVSQSALLKRLVQANVPIVCFNQVETKLQDRYFASLRGAQS